MQRFRQTPNEVTFELARDTPVKIADILTMRSRHLESVDGSPLIENYQVQEKQIIERSAKIVALRYGEVLNPDAPVQP